MPESRTRDLALIASFAALTAALGIVPAISIGGAVPITAQSLGPMLAGAVLGARRGFWSIVLLLALVAIGLPLLAGGRGGLGVFAGPTVGYLVGWAAAAFVVGWLTERLGAPYRLGLGIVANVVGGIVVLYLFGVPALAAITNISLEAALVSNAPFLPGDLLKAVVAALVARGVHQARPGLIRRRERERVGLSGRQQ